MTEQTPYAYGYARMPRIVRKGYKNLTKLQKLLYIYLRDLAGEDGTCYRSLRTLQEETEFSIGYLSENIPILHNEGLIHAEMKSSPSTHWQVWHITIVDIWEKNAAFLQSEKCSPDEHLIGKSVHQMNSSVHAVNSSDESVHTVNESVHAVILNKNPIENHITENNNREEREEVADATSPAVSQSPDFFPNDEERQKYDDFMCKAHKLVAEANNGTRRSKTIKATISKRKPTRTETPLTISAEAIRIMDAWDSIFSRKCTRTENHIKAAELLVPCAPTRDDLSNIRKFCYKSNPKWYSDKGVSLIDVAKNFDKWQSLQEAPQVYEKNGHSPKNNGKMDYNAAIMDTSQNFIKGTEEERAELERRLAEKHARTGAKR